MEQQAAEQAAASPAAEAPTPTPAATVDPAAVEAERRATAEAERRAAAAERRAASAEAQAKAARADARRAAEAARAATATRPTERDPAEERPVESRPTPVSEARATPAPTPRPDPIVIPAGTLASLVLETPLSTKTNKLEDRVDASLNEDIVVNGKVVVPAGTAFRGYISQIQRAGKIGGQATLGIRFTSFRLRGQEHEIDATSIGLKGASAKKDAAVIGGSTAGGAVLGGIIKGKKGAIIGGILAGTAGTVAAAKDRDDVEVPSGVLWEIELTSPVNIN